MSQSVPEEVLDELIATPGNCNTGYDLNTAGQHSSYEGAGSLMLPNLQEGFTQVPVVHLRWRRTEVSLVH